MIAVLGSCGSPAAGGNGGGRREEVGTMELREVLFRNMSAC